jgi:putative tryptophan/tyrosine transport system substrate-binding protein
MTDMVEHRKLAANGDAGRSACQPAAFDAGARERVDGVLVGAESIFIVHRAKISELAAHHKLPAMYPYSIQVTDAAGLMAYDINIPDLQRRAAIYVDRILKGANPGDLPVEQPTKFKFVINVKTAKALDLTIPESILQLADDVIE